MNNHYDCAVLTISDSRFKGSNTDEGGPLVCSLLKKNQFIIKKTMIIPDEVDRITEALRTLCEKDGVSLIVTTGGTGFSPRDVTPEATRAVIEKEVPGLCEAMRMDGFTRTPHALLSRGIAGIYLQTLIINLPGGLKAITEGLTLIMPALTHGLDILHACTTTSHHYQKP